MATLVQLPAVGDIIDGRFRIVSQVSANGAFGSIYVAEQIAMGRDVVVKFLNPAWLGDAAVVARFLREARLVARFNHNNIVACYAFGVWEEQYPYLVFEQLKGVTLREYMDNHILSWQRAFEMVADVCMALEHAHEQGVVHRDLKPDNIFVSDDGTVKLLDFGLAQVADQRLTQTGCFVGTARYVSPEQACGKVATPPSDIYSLGCVLYEMILERPALDAEDAMALLNAHLYELPVRPSAVHEELPSAVDHVLMKAMAKNPGRRFRTAAEFGAVLRKTSAAGGAIDPAAAQPLTGDPAYVSQSMYIVSAAPQKPAVAQPRKGAPVRLAVWMLCMCCAGAVLLLMYMMRPAQTEPATTERGLAIPAALVVDRFSTSVLEHSHNPTDEEMRQARTAVDQLCNEIYAFRNAGGNNKALVCSAREGYTALAWTCGLRQDKQGRDLYFNDAIALAHSNGLPAATAARGWAQMLCLSKEPERAIKVLQDESDFCTEKHFFQIARECDRTINAVRKSNR